MPDVRRGRLAPIEHDAKMLGLLPVVHLLTGQAPLGFFSQQLATEDDAVTLGASGLWMHKFQSPVLCKVADQLQQSPVVFGVGMVYKLQYVFKGCC